MKFISFVLGVVFSFSGFSHAATLEDVLVRLERAEKDIKTLQFDFTQKTIVSLGGRSAETRGTAIFQRPNLFRVNQVAPEPQTFVSNGKQFWVHLIDRGQVLKDTMDNWSQFAGFPQGLTPFQMNVAQMKEKYTFSLAEEEGGGGRFFPSHRKRPLIFHIRSVSGWIWRPAWPRKPNWPQKM